MFINVVDLMRSSFPFLSRVCKYFRVSDVTRLLNAAVLFFEACPYLAPLPAFMSAAVLVAAVVGGGVLLFLRRLFPRQKAAKLLRYTADTMRGKTVVVTGANCGIGKALAGELLKLQARVVMACRDVGSAEEAARDIRKQAGAQQGEVVIKHLDLASLRSVRKFCEEIREVGGGSIVFSSERTDGNLAGEYCPWC